MIAATAAGAGEASRAPGSEEPRECDRWSRERLLAHQRDRLRGLLGHAVSASPYYRDVLGADALAPDVDLGGLPTLSKATLMEHFDRVVTDPRLRLEDVEAHAAGPDPGALLLGEYHLFTTSGTTGRRGIFPQARQEFDAWVDVVRTVVDRLGGRGVRPVGIGAPTPLHITQKLFAALGGFGGGRPRLTVTTPLAELVGALNRDRPDQLFTVTSFAGLLAEEQLAGRLSIEPRSVVVSGEAVAEDVRRRIADAWGVEPFELYSSTEALVLAFESPDRVGLHVNEACVVLEVVDEHDRPVPAGMPGFKVLVTSLLGRTLPLIRYELADTVTMARGRDPSGRPYLRIERVDGRNDDAFRLPAAVGGEVLVLPYRLRAPFATLPDVLEYQIVLEERRLAVRVVLRPSASADAVSRVAEGIRHALEEAGAVPLPIDVEPVARIEREPGGAKLKLVKVNRR